MGMRPRYDESGKIIGAHNMIFDDISDQYKMQRVLIDKDIQEISYVQSPFYLSHHSCMVSCTRKPDDRLRSLVEYSV